MADPEFTDRYDALTIAHVRGTGSLSANLVPYFVRECEYALANPSSAMSIFAPPLELLRVEGNT